MTTCNVSVALIDAKIRRQAPYDTDQPSSEQPQENIHSILVQFTARTSRKLQLESSLEGFPVAEILRVLHLFVKSCKR